MRLEAGWRNGGRGLAGRAGLWRMRSDVDFGQLKKKYEKINNGMK
jgi:hypothetical protein